MFGKKADCPFWRGPCKEHECRLYMQVIGQNTNTGEQINRWGCDVEFLPMLLIENAQQSRQTGAAVESFRNEVVRANTVLNVVHQIAQQDSHPKLIDHPALNRGE